MCLKKQVGGIAGGMFISTKTVIMQFLKSNLFCFALKRCDFRFILLLCLTFSFSNLVLKCFLLYFFVYLLAFSFPCSVFAI